MPQQGKNDGSWILLFIFVGVGFCGGAAWVRYFSEPVEPPPKIIEVARACPDVAPCPEVFAQDDIIDCECEDLPVTSPLTCPECPSCPECPEPCPPDLKVNYAKLVTLVQKADTALKAYKAKLVTTDEQLHACQSQEPPEITFGYNEDVTEVIAYCGWDSYETTAVLDLTEEIEFVDEEPTVSSQSSPDWSLSLGLAEGGTVALGFDRAVSKHWSLGLGAILDDRDEPYFNDGNFDSPNFKNLVEPGGTEVKLSVGVRYRRGHGKSR